MAKIKGVKDEIAGKTKRVVGEILGDQKLDDEGKAQERQGREDAEKPVKPLGNLDQLT
jgi:uncharacterized protein YjbJ (UPF0337 family)